MASQATATEDSHSYYPSSSWVQSVDTPPVSGTTTPAASSSHQASPWSAPSATPHSASDHSNPQANLAPHQLDIWPLFLPHQASLYQAQLLHYTNLVSPGRGGGLQQAHQSPSSINTVATSSATHPTPSRSRASSRVSNKENPPLSKGAEKGHGNKGAHNKEKGDRAVIASAKESQPPHTMPHQKSQRQQTEPAAAAASSSSSAAASTSTSSSTTTTTTTTTTLPPRPRVGPKHSPQTHSSSVPSTPQQHARNFSYESREPSPTHNANHSPRSAYSETNSALPSLRPLQGCPFETAQNRFRRRMPYNIGSGGLEKVDPSGIKAKLSEEHEKKLTADMRELYDRLLPTERVEENRKKLCAKLEKIFNDEWPGHDIRVHLFGSSGNLLCSDDSDVDICITTPWKELEGVCAIADLLHKKGMKKVVCISAAKVPIVKAWDPELGLACDMNVNNTQALENTRMVRTYIEIDPRIRPLAMIIKYWTRRRVLNDAAFGSTLSSYTWICMIIAFLQLRDTPIVPALHQRLPKRAGQPDSAFADDLDKLRGFGDKNKSTLGELLFQFFRYYAHEFDYEKHVLSVRQGRKLSKTEKKWAHNLCVEEPFNTGRNLGNTADEYSFRGLHMELRRAFDAIAEANLELCCEQFVFPKEETPTFIRPVNAPRPVMIRSSSGANAGRGGRNNNRGGRNYNNNRNGNSNRRASSSVAYDTNTMYMPAVTMTAQELAWYAAQQQQQQQQQHQQQNQQLQYPTMLYTQAQVYQQMQAHMAAQYAQQQRAQVSTQTAQAQTAQQQQQQQQQQGSSTERSRTNSIDMAPPLSAPLVGHEWYAMYGFPYQAFYAPNGYAYPSSPATAAPNGTSQSEYRRSMQRSPLATETGASAAGSSLRSQSQPASRSVSNAQGQQYSGSAPQGTGIAAATRQANGSAVPSFVADERDVDAARPLSNSPPVSDEGTGPYIGYYVTDAASPNRRASQALPNGIAFGDIAQDAAQGRRRLSTEQLPQTLLDRRMRRASRSPSPLGHGRAFSVGTSTNPQSSSALAGNVNGARSAARPLIVNGTGSSLRTSSTHSQPTPVTATDDALRATQDNPLQIQGYGFSSHHVGSVDSQSSVTSDATPQAAPEQRTGPVIVNGSSNVPSIPSSSSGPLQGQEPAAYHSEEASFRERIMMSQHLTSQALSQQDFRFPPASSRQKISGRPGQSGGIAPLDLATGSSRINGHSQSVDAQHLSPINETRSPSPTTVRKGEHQLPNKVKRPSNLAEEAKAVPAPETKQAQPVQPPARATASQLSQALKLNGARENGHVRGAKSESHGGDGGWQKATKGRKKGTEARNTGSGSSEQPPQHEADRKGG